MSKVLSNGAFFGAVARSRATGGLVLSQTRYAPRFVVPSHAHENPFFCFVIRGSFTERFNRSREILGPTAVFFHPSGEAHAEEFHERDSHLFNIQLSKDWLLRLDRFGVRPPQEQQRFRTERINQMAARLLCEYTIQDTAAALIIDGLVLAMVAEVLRADSKPEGRPGWLAQVIQILHDRSNETLTIAQIAEEAGVDPVHLSQTFRTHHGCTIGEYSRRLRVTRAMELIAAGDESLGSIAHMLGFADQSHFSRVFKKHTGFTPGAYRRHAKIRW